MGFIPRSLHHGNGIRPCSHGIGGRGPGNRPDKSTGNDGYLGRASPRATSYCKGEVLDSGPCACRLKKGCEDNEGKYKGRIGIRYDTVYSRHTDPEKFDNPGRLISEMGQYPGHIGAEICIKYEHCRQDRQDISHRPSCHLKGEDDHNGSHHDIHPIGVPYPIGIGGILDYPVPYRCNSDQTQHPIEHWHPISGLTFPEGIEEEAEHHGKQEVSAAMDF